MHTSVSCSPSCASKESSRCEVSGERQIRNGLMGGCRKALCGHARASSAIRRDTDNISSYKEGKRSVKSEVERRRMLTARGEEGDNSQVRSLKGVRTLGVQPISNPAPKG